MARLGVGTVDKDQRGDITVQAQPTCLLEGERAVGVVADYGVDHRQATELFKPVGHVAQGRCRIPEFASPPRGHGELERGRDSGSGFAYALSGAPRKAQRLRAFVPCVVDVPVLAPLTCIDRVQQLRADSARAASASTKVGDGQVHFRRFVEEQDPEGDVGAFGEGPSLLHRRLGRAVKPGTPLRPRGQLPFPEPGTLGRPTQHRRVDVDPLRHIRLPPLRSHLMLPVDSIIAASRAFLSPLA